MTEPVGLRERKKRRTRRALMEAAYRLFDERGYEETTVGAIAEAADVSPATFYLHFPTKEDVLFVDGPHYLDIAVDAIADRRPDDQPSDTLVRALRRGLEAGRGDVRDITGELEEIRLRLITSTPALQARTLHRVFSGQQHLAAALQRAYPDRVDDLDAAALVGAVTGAILAAVHVAVSSGRPLEPAVERVFDLAGRLGA